MLHLQHSKNLPKVTIDCYAYIFIYQRIAISIMVFHSNFSVTFNQSIDSSSFDYGMLLQYVLLNKDFINFTETYP